MELEMHRGSPRQSGLRSTFLKTALGRVHALASDPGRSRSPVVLVHGSGVPRERIRPMAELLTDDRRVVVPDLPGFGSESAPRKTLDLDGLTRELEAVLDAMHARCVSLVGSCLGGPVAAEFAIRWPDRVKSLVLLGMTVNPEHRAVAPQLTRWILQGQRHDHDAVQAQHDSALGLCRLRDTFRFTCRDRLEARLPRIPCPTLILCGDHDPLFPEESALESTKRVPHGRLGVVRGSTPSLLGDSFELCARHIQRFV